MSATAADNARLARMCREALGSLHCELSRREKCVLEQIVTYSFELDQDFAWFGSSDQLALEAELHKTDASSALSNLRRMRIIHAERAASLAHFRKPMIYRIFVAELVRVASRPAVSENRGVQHAKASTAAYLVHANRCYPLQPELLPPDPNELELAMAEISRASALAQDLIQNAAPKPGDLGPGEASSAEDDAPPGRTLDFPNAWPLSRDPVTPEEAGRRVRESLEQANSPIGTSGFDADGLRRSLEGPQGSVVVGESQTTPRPSLKFSNYPRARDQRSDNSDGEFNSPSENQMGDARGPVGEFQTTPRLGIVLEASLVLSRYGEVWTPPTAAEEVFEELTRAMDTALTNYGSWWFKQCLDPRTRRDVLEAIATWKLARHSPKHKPWRGGRWRDEFFKRQRARLAARDTPMTHPSETIK